MKITDIKDFTPFETQLILTLHRIASALEKLVDIDYEKI